jgi:hypothetical protein
VNVKNNIAEYHTLAKMINKDSTKVSQLNRKSNYSYWIMSNMWTSQIPLPTKTIDTTQIGDIIHTDVWGPSQALVVLNISRYLRTTLPTLNRTFYHKIWFYEKMKYPKRAYPFSPLRSHGPRPNWKQNSCRGDRGYVGHGAIMYKAIKTCKIRLKIVK